VELPVDPWIRGESAAPEEWRSRIMMRDVAIAIVLVLLVGSVANAASPGEVRGGPRIGFSMANWRGSDADKLADNMVLVFEYEGFEGCSFSKEMRLGFAVGGFVRLDINPRFAIQPEVAYTLKGVKYAGGCYYEGYRVDIDYVFKTNYIECPVLGVVKLGFPRRTNFNLLFGPYLGIKTGSSLKVTASAVGQSNDETVDYGGVNKMDLGIILGGGISHPSGFVADVRYGIGIMGVHEESDAIEVKNAVFAITAGYMF
jgi:hypothetical protein